MSTRFANVPHSERLRGGLILKPDHPAVQSSHTMFLGRVEDPRSRVHVIQSGKNQRKLGDRVLKGEWKGSPIYSLTLEERATCPSSCHHWLSCYGNNMPFSKRMQADDYLIPAVWSDLKTLSAQHETFVVRLHILGDFYSRKYVIMWRRALQQFKGLRVFGYTAHQPGTELGDAIQATIDAYPEHFRIRVSTNENREGPYAITVMDERDAGRAIVCPAQRGRTSACGTCALCWSGAAWGRAIAFLQH